MALQDREIRKIGAIALIAVLLILSFMVIRPILLSIVTGLIIAYIFYPVYKKVHLVLRERNLSALAVSIIAVLLIFIPLWFILPLAIQQMFEIFQATQTLDVSSFVEAVIPGASQQLKIDITTTIISFVGAATSGILGTLTGFIFNLPNILLQFTVVIFVFFFALRDADKLKQYASEISPLKKEKGRILVKQFKDLTSSILYGQVIVGILQGIFAGIGLLIFGVPRALLLTLLAVLASIVPMIGPWLVWIPAAGYLFYSGQFGAAIGFTIFNIVIVSTIDNLLRPYIVARKTKISSVIILVGMIGGLIVFGVLGLILGPLILAYLILFMEAYKNKTIADLFNPE